MDDIIGKMCSQLRESYYGNEKDLLKEQDSEENKESSEDEKATEVKTFDANSEQAKNFINNIKNYLKNGFISFESILFDPKNNKFTWEGEIERKIKWEFIYIDGEKTQVFFQIQNPEDLDEESTLSLHKLNTYFRQNLSDDISTAIQNKQF
jgi:hypothetical protein